MYLNLTVQRLSGSVIGRLSLALFESDPFVEINAMERPQIKSRVLRDTCGIVSVAQWETKFSRLVIPHFILLIVRMFQNTLNYTQEICYLSTDYL